LETALPTIDLYTEVIIGSRRSIKSVALECATRTNGRQASPEDWHLLLAINPQIPPSRPRPRPLRCVRCGGNTYLFSFPRWMDQPLDAQSWISQSNSGALYLSRTDLRLTFGVPGVLLLQILEAAPRGPCFTSLHEHYETREIFDPLDDAGQTEFRRGHDPWNVLKQRLEIAPRELHQLRRISPGVSVNLIQMYGACSVESGPGGPRLDMSDHIYFSPGADHSG
jgi:hypothetical protein